MGTEYNGIQQTLITDLEEINPYRTLSVPPLETRIKDITDRLDRLHGVPENNCPNGVRQLALDIDSILGACGYTETEAGHYHIYEKYPRENRGVGLCHRYLGNENSILRVWLCTFGIDSQFYNILHGREQHPLSLGLQFIPEGGRIRKLLKQVVGKNGMNCFEVEHLTYEGKLRELRVELIEWGHALRQLRGNSNHLLAAVNAHNEP
jgi:hypothetical protein